MTIKPPPVDVEVASSLSFRFNRIAILRLWRPLPRLVKIFMCIVLVTVLKYSLMLIKWPELLGQPESAKIIGIPSKAKCDGDSNMCDKPSPSLHPPPILLHISQTSKKDTSEVICVLLLACNRVTVRKSLDQLLKYRPSAHTFPIIVSQDCGHEPTAKVLRSYGEQIRLIRHPDLSDISLPVKEKKFKGYYKIARHYAWALNQTFNFFNHQAVIVVEDDLDIAPDFFEYFRALYPVMKADPTLWCASAWNDNGKKDLIAEDSADTLYRSDFFPGLGWMLTKDVWLEFQGKWPKAFWDDWIRQPPQRKERACVRPEISRTKTFGKVGVSNGLFYEKHLKFIKLNEKFVPFTQYNLSYLLKDPYDEWFLKTVYSSPVVTVHQLTTGQVEGEGPVRIVYRTKIGFKSAAKAFRLMDDFKSGVPRTGYRGVVSFMFRKRRVFLAPLEHWNGYDTSWV